MNEDTADLPTYGAADQSRPIIWGKGRTEAEALANAKSAIERQFGTDDPRTAEVYEGLRVIHLGQPEAAISPHAFDQGPGRICLVCGDIKASAIHDDERR